jgi:hypothetical protein
MRTANLADGQFSPPTQHCFSELLSTGGLVMAVMGANGGGPPDIVVTESGGARYEFLVSVLLQSSAVNTEGIGLS